MKIFNKLSRNTGAKLLAFLFALVLWFYVAILQNPLTSANVRNIEIVFSNMAELKSKNLIVTTDITDALDVKIQAPRSQVAKINSKNIKGIVDLSGYGSGEHEIPIKVDFLANDVTIEKRNLTTLKVNIDTLSKRTIAIEIKNAPENAKVSPAKVAIEGPKGRLDLIDKVGADMADGGKIKLYSSNGTEIEDNLLTLSEKEVRVE